MTLLVGVATRKGVWIGADSGSVADAYSVSVPDPKVWNTGQGWIVACAGEWRALELVRHAVEWPQPPKTVQDAHKVVSIDVIDSVRKAFDQRGYECEPDEDGAPQWFMLLGTKTASRAPLLFYVEADHPERHRHIACGTGEEYALGVLSQNTHQEPVRRVRATLAATRIRYGCLLPPYRVEAL